MTNTWDTCTPFCLGKVYLGFAKCKNSAGTTEHWNIPLQQRLVGPSKWGPRGRAAHDWPIRLKRLTRQPAAQPRLLQEHRVGTGPSPEHCPAAGSTVTPRGFLFGSGNAHGWGREVPNSTCCSFLTGGMRRAGDKLPAPACLGAAAGHCSGRVCCPDSRVEPP